MKKGLLHWISSTVFSSFIYLATSGLSCITQDLLWCTDSPVAACRPTICGIIVPQSGIKPSSFALQDGVLTTGPPGKSYIPSILINDLPVVVWLLRYRLQSQPRGGSPGSIKGSLLSSSWISEVPTTKRVKVLTDEGGPEEVWRGLLLFSC